MAVTGTSTTEANVANAPKNVQVQDRVELDLPLSTGSNLQQDADLTEIYEVPDETDGHD